MIIWEGNNSEITVMVNEMLVKIKNNKRKFEDVYKNTNGIKYYYNYVRRRDTKNNSTLNFLNMLEIK